MIYRLAILIIITISITGCDTAIPLSDKWLEKYHYEYATNYSVYVPLVEQIKANKSITKFVMSDSPSCFITMIRKDNGEENIWSGYQSELKKESTNLQLKMAYNWLQKMRDYNLSGFYHWEGEEIWVFLTQKLVIVFLYSSAPNKHYYDNWAKVHTNVVKDYCIKLDENVYLLSVKI